MKAESSSISSHNQNKNHETENVLKEKVINIIKVMIDEFNCNHQADLDSPNQVKIYERENEHKKI